MAGMDYRFAFDEVVRVVSEDPELSPINGELGEIVGRTDDPSQPTEYGVFVYRDEEVWQLGEGHLEPTGRYVVREPPTHALRVRVDDQGRGELAGIVEF